MNAPSYAATLYLLAQGHELPGAELLPLIGPGPSDLHPKLTYSLADVPELLNRAGHLAEAVDPEGGHGLFELTISQHIEGMTGRLPSPIPAALWTLGFAADMHADFYHQYRPELRRADRDAPFRTVRN